MDAAERAAIDPRSVLKGDKSIAKKLVGYAYKKTHDVDRAEVAAQEAVTCVLEGEWFCRWDPSSKSLLNHLADLVDSVVAIESRRARGWREVPSDLRLDENPDSDPNSDGQLIDGEERQNRLRLASEIMRRLEKDSLATKVLELEEEGIGDAAEQARRAGCAVIDIHLASARVAKERDAMLESAQARPDEGGAR